MKMGLFKGFLRKRPFVSFNLALRSLGKAIPSGEVDGNKSINTQMKIALGFRVLKMCQK